MWTSSQHSTQFPSTITFFVFSQTKGRRAAVVFVWLSLLSVCGIFIILIDTCAKKEYSYFYLNVCWLCFFLCWWIWDIYSIFINRKQFDLIWFHFWDFSETTEGSEGENRNRKWRETSSVGLEHTDTKGNKLQSELSCCLSTNRETSGMTAAVRFVSATFSGMETRLCEGFVPLDPKHLTYTQRWARWPSKKWRRHRDDVFVTSETHWESGFFFLQERNSFCDVYTDKNPGFRPLLHSVFSIFHLFHVLIRYSASTLIIFTVHSVRGSNVSLIFLIVSLFDTWFFLFSICDAQNIELLCVQQVLFSLILHRLLHFPRLFFIFLSNCGLVADISAVFILCTASSATSQAGLNSSCHFFQQVNHVLTLTLIKELIFIRHESIKYAI